MNVYRCLTNVSVFFYILKNPVSIYFEWEEPTSRKRNSTSFTLRVVSFCQWIMPCQSSSFHDSCVFLTYIKCVSVDEILLYYTNGLVHTVLDEYLYIGKFFHTSNHLLSFPYWVFLAVHLFFKIELLEYKYHSFGFSLTSIAKSIKLPVYFIFLKDRSEKWKDFPRPSLAISLSHSIDINTWTHKDAWSIPCHIHTIEAIPKWVFR